MKYATYNESYNMTNHYETVYLGPVIDETYAEQVFKEMKGVQNICYVPYMEHANILELMSTAILMKVQKL